MKLQDYQPRSVFLPLHNRSKRWATVVAHRRAGKTVAMCADIVIGALETALPRPQFAYLAPYREQAKRVAWNYLKELTKDVQLKEPNESELRIDIRNGHGGESRIYVAGADNPDALRGMYFDGIVMDETGQMRPSVWYSVLRPALSDRKGWAIFAGTPAGKNFFWQLREEARLNPNTHILLELPASKTGILDAEELRDAKAQMTPEAYETEYEISFEAAIPGAYYARQIGDLYGNGQIGEHKLDPNLPVDFAADLGFTDSCSWWGWQTTYDGYRLVEFYEADGQPIQHYIDWVKSRPYKVGNVYLPHDAKAKSLQTGKSIVEQFLKNGIKPNIAPELSLQDGIEAARLILNKCWFDESATYDGIDHLRGYMREWDERTQTFKSKPKHDQHSHCFVAGTEVSTPNGLRAIEQIAIGDMVNTPDGPREVDATMSRVADQLVELEFDNGAKVVCTPDHPFFTEEGIVVADALRYSHHVVVEAPCVSNIPFKSSTESVSIESHRAISKPITSSTAISTCTGMSGKSTTGLFRRTSTFITRTATRATTRLRTWSCLPKQNISASTTGSVVTLTLAGGPMVCVRLETPQKSGTQAMKAVNATAKSDLNRGLAGRCATTLALIVARAIKHLQERSRMAVAFAATIASRLRDAPAAWTMSTGNAASARLSSVATSTAQPRHAARLVAKRRLQERPRVYDLTVRDQHVFYANGLLVSNCADAFRYFALSARALSPKSQPGSRIAPVSKGMHYAFSLDSIWDTGPKAVTRIG